MLTIIAYNSSHSHALFYLFISSFSSFFGHAQVGMYACMIINPRRACARVTVLVLSVCLCVCFPYSGTSRNQAYKQQYQRLQRDTGMKYKKGFFIFL